MKINFSLLQNSIFDSQDGNRLKSVTPVYSYENGKRTDTIIGSRLRFAVLSDLFPDLDYLSVKVPVESVEDLDLSVGAKYLVEFENLIGVFYVRSEGSYTTVEVSLSADNIKLEEIL